MFGRRGVAAARPFRVGRGNWFWKGCKPNSVCTLAGGENHLSQQPIPGILPRWREWSGPLRDSLFGLAPDGVFRAVPLTRDAVRSYRTFSPLPTVAAVCDRRIFPALTKRRYNFGGLIFCGTVRRKASRLSARVYPRKLPGLRGIAPSGVRTFLPVFSNEAILHPSKTMANLAAKGGTDKWRVCRPGPPPGCGPPLNQE
jgi:hypothetical protein